MELIRFVAVALPLVLFVGTGCVGDRRGTRAETPELGAGVASWYGPGLHGNLTANGERFDKNALTAAHRKLPFNTCVRVKNVDNGREVQVRINDRGPYAKGRIIDVSEAAGRELGMIEKGVARVELRRCR